MRNTNKTNKFVTEFKVNKVTTQKVADTYAESTAGEFDKVEDIVIKKDNYLDSDKNDSQVIKELKSKASVDRDIDTRDTFFFTKQSSHLGNIESLINTEKKRITETDKVLLTRIATKLDTIRESKHLIWSVDDLWDLLQESVKGIPNLTKNYLNSKLVTHNEKKLGFNKNDLTNYFDIPVICQFKDNYLNNGVKEILNGLKVSLINIQNKYKVNDDLKKFCTHFFSYVEKSVEAKGFIGQWVYNSSNDSSLKKNTGLHLQEMQNGLSAINIRDLQEDMSSIMKNYTNLVKSFNNVREENETKVIIYNSVIDIEDLVQDD